MAFSFHPFPEDFPRTETLHGQADGAPVAVACRGRHPLGYQSQQIRRDLFAEQITAPGASHDLRVVETDEHYRAWFNTPCRFLVQAYGSLTVTTFRTREGLEAWLEAYGLQLDDHGKVLFGVAPMQDLGWIPVPIDQRQAGLAAKGTGFLPEALPEPAPAFHSNRSDLVPCP